MVARVDEAYIYDYPASPGSGFLAADDAASLIGLLSYSFYASLVHAGRSCYIEELAVELTTQRKCIVARKLDHRGAN